MLLKKKKTKSSTEKQSTAIIVHEAKRTATSTRTTHTRHNKPFEAPAVQQRRCPQLSSSLAVSAVVRTWCGGETSTSKRVRVFSNAMLLKKKKTKSSTEKQITAIIVHEAKRTATSTRTHTRHNKPFEAAAVQHRWCSRLSSSFCGVKQRYALGAAAKRVRVNEYEYLVTRCS